MKRLLIMAGGTGGHIFAGLTIAKFIIDRGWQVYWLGTANHMESSLVPKEGISIDYININGIKDKKLKDYILAPINIIIAIIQSIIIMLKRKPDIVLGMGGYVAGPGGIAAWLCKIPLIIHEQNYVAGLTNKLLYFIASEVMQGYPDTFKDAKTVGNPVHKDLIKLPLPYRRLYGRTGPIRVLIIGGSQGARILNQVMPKVANILIDKITVWHQIGNDSLKNIIQCYGHAYDTQYKIMKFITNMAEAYSWADLIVCRSGALTISEISIVGLPSILVPFPHKDRQQYWNAYFLKKSGAAEIFECSQFTVETVVNTIIKWDRSILIKMANKAKKMAIYNATEKIIDIIERVSISNFKKFK